MTSASSQAALPAISQNAAIELLDRLIAFDTVSSQSNLELIHFVKDYLAGHGINSDLIMNEEKTKANLFATIGPNVPGGIILSGHTDVVPVEGQDWDSDPFTMTERDGRLYGRGTADMKGFVSAVLAAVPDFKVSCRTRPIHIALSYDEEIGCVGVRPMIDFIVETRPRPALALVGEPTSMGVVNAHKGIRTFLTEITGLEAHSSRTHEGVSAITAAARLTLFLNELEDELRRRADPQSRFTPPHTTISVGQVEGGTAVNIIPRHCTMSWEHRSLPSDDDDEIVTRLNSFVHDTVLPEMRTRAPNASIDTQTRSHSIGLDAAKGSPAEELALRLAQQNAVHAVAYATEAGLFQQAGIPTVVCGPGDIAQAHKPNEFLAKDQLAECQLFLRRLCSAL